MTEALAYIVRNSGGVRDLLRVLAAGASTMREVTETAASEAPRSPGCSSSPRRRAQTIYSLDEHWDGKGHPHGLAGEEIPILARIACLAQTTEVFLREHGLDAALEMAEKRSGRWFDPALVRILRAAGADREFWRSVESRDAGARVAALEPDDRLVIADEARLDRVAEAFAQVIDAKSPYTFRHSERVAEIAVATATTLGFSEESLRDLRRAGRLHDIGKLAISNLILDKPGKADRGGVRRPSSATRSSPSRSCGGSPASPTSPTSRPRTTRSWTARATTAACTATSWACPRASWPSPTSSRR